MSKVILFAVLDWGLGHASRSIPLIKNLIAKQHKVIICGDGLSFVLLQKEFPNAIFEELPSYDIKYAYNSIRVNIALQIPKIVSAISQEKKVTDKILRKHNANMIISDNRYGCHNSEVPSFIISHQLNIQSKPKWQGSFMSSILNRFLKKFDQVWIPDFEGVNSLAGDLAQNKQVKNKVFIGPLSRMQSLDSTSIYDLCVVLSGPEPQRTYFEETILNQLNDFRGKAIIVRGTNKKRSQSLAKTVVLVEDLLKTEELNKIICSSQLIISRSGYSSIMDYYQLGVKAILIPTPGQTEQEYLAQYLMKKGLCYSTEQSEFKLQDAMKKSKKFAGFQANDGIECIDIEELV